MTESDTMNLESQVRELATGLRDIILETPDAYLKENPEDAYVDLACRLIFRLAGKLAILPAEQIATAHVRDGQARAAVRTLDILSKWLRAHPKCGYGTEIGASGKIELTMKVAGETRGFFQGESVQDAYAQAAQVVDFNGGTL